MKLYEDERFEINNVPFSIRRVRNLAKLGCFILFQDGRFRCRGTKKLCKEWAAHFAKVTNEV